MLMIRLQRVGKKNQAMFRLVLTDKQNGPKSGRFKEVLGSYNPHQNEIQFDGERIKHWIGNGAQASDTVHNLLIKEGIIKGDKKNVLPKKSPIIKEVEEGTEEQPTTEEAPAEDGETPEEKVEEKIEEAPQEEVTETPVEEVKEEKQEEPKEETKEEEKPTD